MRSVSGLSLVISCGLLLAWASACGGLSARAADFAQPNVPLGGDYWKGTAPEAKSGAHPPVWGFADLHAHFFNYLAYGGRIFHGKTFAPGGMPEALDDCGHDHGSLGGKSLAILPEGSHRTAGYPKFESWPRYDSMVHQQAYVDWIRRAWQGGLRIVQMDVQNTAFMGHAYAFGNRLFLHGNLTPIPFDDISQLRIQVEAAHALFDGGPASDFAAIAKTPEEARAIIESGKLAVVLGIEVEAIGNLLKREQLGPDPLATIRLVLDDLWAAGVRHVIPIHLTRNAFGHPAFFQRVLNASNYAETGTWYDVGEAFDRGIRFDADHAPSDPITWFFEFWAGLHGHRAYPKGLRAAAAQRGLTPEGELLVGEMLRRGFIVDVEHMSEIGAERTLELAEAQGVPIMASHGNFRDLTFGNTLTYHSDGTYEARPLDLPFGQAGHGEYGTSDPRKTQTERSHSRDLILRIRKLGGMIGMGISTDSVGVSWRNKVKLDCDGSAKSFAQQLLYANEVLGGQGFAIGSDVSGLSSLPAPRFGVDACPGARGDSVRAAHGLIRAQALAQSHGVRYATPMAALGPWRFQRRGKNDDTPYSKKEAKAWLTVATARSSGKTLPLTDAAARVVSERWDAMQEAAGTDAPLERSRAGTREWDVNVDGVAHYGLLPDFMQDLANVLRDAGQGDQLAPLFQSAEYYLKMWERLAQHARTARLAAEESAR